MDRGERADTALQAQTFAQLLHELREKDWVVYAKRPFAGPEQVLAYLARYTHRVAISNERLLGFDEDTVRFRWRDRRRSNRPRVLSLSREEFLRRFLLHVLPSGFMRLRHFGLFANRTRSRKLALAYAALQQPPPDPPERESAAALMQRVTGIDIERCPHCQCGRLRIVAVDRAAWQQTPPATGPPP